MGTGRKKEGSERSHSFDEMLAIIQHDEHLFFPDPYFKLFISGEFPSFHKTERLNDGGSNASWVIQRSQRDEKNTIEKVWGYGARRFDAQAGFANPRRTQQGDEADIFLHQIF